MGNIRKVISATCLMCLICLVVTGCTKPHTHQWAKATCTKPETCTICGKTEGEPLGHQPGEPERFDHDDGYAVITHCTVCGKVASKDYVSMFEDDSKLGGVTIGDFIDSYNEFAEENNKVESRLSDLQPVSFSAVEQDGATGELKVTDDISVSFIYCGKYSPKSPISNITLTGELTSSNEDEVSAILEAVLYGIDHTLFTEHFDEIFDYYSGVTGPPDIYGYTFLDLTDGSNLFFLIKYD